MPEIIELNSSNEQDTIRIAAEIGSLLRAGDLLVINGELGAGKTYFAKGIAKGLDIDDMVNSPTYTLINEYQGRLPFYHWDVYRLSDPEEIFELGSDEYFYGRGVTLIEWGERIAELLPEEYLQIDIERLQDDISGEQRLLRITAKGSRYESLLKELSARCMY